MSVHTLTHHNFTVLGSHKKTLCVNINVKLLLVFFKMDTCNICAQFEPIFYQLSQTDTRVSYGILNITQNREIAIWSRQTSTPINAVPTLILYVDGKPHVKFNGNKNIPSIQNFITQALSTTGGNSAAMPPQAKPFVNQNMYGPPTVPGGPQQHKSWMPEIGAAPSMKGMIKGGGGYGPGGVDDDDDNVLRIPDNVVPWNTPWDAESGV